MFPRANMSIVHLKKRINKLSILTKLYVRTASLQGGTSTFYYLNTFMNLNSIAINNKHGRHSRRIP